MMRRQQVAVIVALEMCEDHMESMAAMPPDRWQIELDRARRRRDQAAQGSPDWDAASEAVLELEAYDPEHVHEQPRRKLFLMGSRAAAG